MLVGDAHIDIGNLVVVEHLGGLSGKRVAYLGAMEEHDVVLDAEGEAAATVHDSGDGDVGQGEECTTLTNTSSIEMIGGDGELGAGIALAHFFQNAAIVGSEAVVLRQEFFKCHSVMR